LRIAEQKLKAGDVLQARQLLQRLEVEFPGRRLDGLYCFLRAESDRLSGRYEEALRCYEMILKLPQWAGFKDRALFGFADTYLRMGDLKRAKEWLGALKEGFPKTFEEKKGPDLEKLLARRLDRAGKGGKDERLVDLRFALEPEDPESWGTIHDLSVVCAPGMAGGHALLMDRGHGVINYFDWYRPVKSMVPGGLYLFEIWYRELVRVPPPAPHQVTMVGFNVLREGEAGDGTGMAVEMPRNTHHRWHKLTVPIRLPLDQDFRFRVRFGNTVGHFLFDRASLRFVSDRHQDALINFLEGAKE
jgi:tetratricopeptide (TPR) repeat protein